MIKWVLFFDGDCAFCARSVRWVFALDRRGVISFAPLQGELARRHGLAQHADERHGTMVVMREDNGGVFLRSDALLELARALGGWWRIAIAARLIPRPLRDQVYRWIARNRHHLAISKDEACRLPEPALLERMRK